MTDNIQPLSKAITSGYNFTLEDYIEADVRDVVKPGLLTALVGPSFEANETDTFKYDKQERTVALPDVKAFTENGGEQLADGATQLPFVIGSFGTGSTVKRQDWYKRRKVGGMPNEKMTEEDAVAEAMDKIQTSWDLHTEQGIATLITQDTNLLALGGGSNIHPSYDYSNVINGASRAEEAVDLAGAASDVANRFTMSGKVRELREEMSKLRLSATRMICLCSDEFFQARYNSEAQLNVNRELRTTVDLGTQSIPMYENGGFPYYNFVSSDGIWYINVSGEILNGSPLIAAKKAYLMPMTPGLMSVQLAPTYRRGFEGEVARNIYTFAKESDYGIQMLTESNRLYFNKAPQLIKALTLP